MLFNLNRLYKQAKRIIKADQFTFYKNKKKINRKKKKKMKEKVFKDWNVSELLHFPHLEPSLEKEKHKQREIYETLRKECVERNLKETEAKIDRIDVEINLDRLMQKDIRYMGLIRSRGGTVSISNFFNTQIMNRIWHDARILIKHDDDENFKKEFTKRIEQTIHQYFPGEQRQCHRHVKHDVDFAKNESDRVFKMDAFGIDEVKIDTEKVRREDREVYSKLPKLNPINNNLKQQKMHNISQGNEDLVHEKEKEEEQNAEKSIKRSIIKKGSFSSQNSVSSQLKRHVSFTILRPKNQIATSESLKLPKI